MSFAPCSEAKTLWICNLLASLEPPEPKDVHKTLSAFVLWRTGRGYVKQRQEQCVFGSALDDTRLFTSDNFQPSVFSLAVRERS
jgi:hypothetical protein